MTPETKNQRSEQTEITKKTESVCPFRYFRLLRYLQFCCLCLALCSTANAQKAQASEDRSKLQLGNRVLLTSEKDGFMSVSKIRYSPDGKRFVVIACGYECNDNIGFLFNADGSGKRKFTARWDNILQDKVEWAIGGKQLFYYRVNSSGAEPPANAPASGWVEVDAATGRKSPATARTLRPEASYAVFRIPPDDSLNVREAPGAKSKITGKLAHDSTGIHYAGEKQKAGRETWAKIKHQNLTGWVNQNFLYETPKDQ